MNVPKQILDASKATYASIENRLADVFKVILPRKEFVNGLGRQIKIHPPPAAPRVTDTYLILLLAAALFSLLTLIVLGVRAALSLFRIHRRSPRQA